MKQIKGRLFEQTSPGPPLLPLAIGEAVQKRQTPGGGSFQFSHFWGSQPETRGCPSGPSAEVMRIPGVEAWGGGRLVDGGVWAWGGCLGMELGRGRSWGPGEKVSVRCPEGLLVFF